MSIASANEPGGRTTMLTPNSLNEPTTKEDLTPTLTGMDPSNAVALTDPPLQVTLTGTNFIVGFTRVKFGEGDLEPIVVDTTRMTIVIVPELFPPGTVTCSAYNGEYETEALDFTFTDGGGA